MSAYKSNFDRRKSRVRRHLAKHAKGKVRLSIYRSSKHIYAQVIDDAKGETVASASTLDKDVRKDIKNGATVEAATKIGSLVAERAKKAGVDQVVFDRGGYIYHGRVKAVADGAREAGLKF